MPFTKNYLFDEGVPYMPLCELVFIYFSSFLSLNMPLYGKHQKTLQVLLRLGLSGLSGETCVDKSGCTFSHIFKSARVPKRLSSMS
ncbi:hypothetical protein [Psychromonas ossibalaenae]|uniref:hypothetical protein n=1 Tax=Psychromonas ossibalaenae TaxID=444922 RepID=UPI00036C79A5|nr:hypothetical protein [Psychromonas ossibalaenae]